MLPSMYTFGESVKPQATRWLKAWWLHYTRYHSTDCVLTSRFRSRSRLRLCYNQLTINSHRKSQSSTTAALTVWYIQSAEVLLLSYYTEVHVYSMHVQYQYSRHIQLHIHLYRYIYVHQHSQLSIQRRRQTQRVHSVKHYRHHKGMGDWRLDCISTPKNDG